MKARSMDCGDFPSSGDWDVSSVDAELAAATSLDSLVYFRDSLPVDATLEQVHRAFGLWRVGYIPMVRDGRVPAGLASRAQIGHLLGSRFGFSLFSGAPATEALVPHPLIVANTEPVTRVIDLALARREGEFNEDVVLIDEAGDLLGLIRVETLAQLQSKIVKEQMDALQRQQERQARQNVELFQANHALRQSQGLYLVLFENHALGVALLDVEGRIQARNRRFESLMRIGERVAVGPTCLRDALPEKDRAGFLRMLEKCQRGAALTEELHLNVARNETRIFRCSIGWVRETGQVCVCLDDISEQRSLERQMALRDKQTLLESLVGGIAHELNNKLTPVQGFAELLENLTGASTRGYPRLISQSVMEATRIVRQLRELAAPAEVETRRLDLRGLVNEALAMMRFHFRDATCRLRTELPEEPVWVQVDGGQIKQVVMNLVLNAIDAMQGQEDGLLTVSVTADETRCRLRVSDTGPGIHPENLRRIFDPFFTTKGPDKGTGLGLSICLSIVRQYGGEICAESVQGSGAVFTATLPVDARNETAILFSEPLDPAGARSAWHKRAAGSRVLVVDDEEVLRHLLQEQFRVCFECQVDLATNGIEALERVADGNYDLIVTDLLMPGMSGREFYERLKTLSPEQARRVVFVTGYAGGRELERDIGELGVPVIRKPFSQPVLEEVCRPFLESAQAR